MSQTSKLVHVLASYCVEHSSPVSSCTVTGTPPTFNVEPQDMVVFARDAAGNRASLNLTCMASGSPAPIITWFRNRAPLSLDQRITVNPNGTLLIANITENTDTTRAGVSYHCTAMNRFGTIRSRTAVLSYACELQEKGGGEGRQGSTLQGTGVMLCSLFQILVVLPAQVE